MSSKFAEHNFSLWSIFQKSFEVFTLNLGFVGWSQTVDFFSVQKKRTHLLHPLVTAMSIDPSVLMAMSLQEPGDILMLRVVCSYSPSLWRSEAPGITPLTLVDHSTDSSRPTPSALSNLASESSIYLKCKEAVSIRFRLISSFGLRSFR